MACYEKNSSAYKQVRHNNMTKATIYILVTLLLTSCEWMGSIPKRTDENLYSLYRQRIENSDQILYQFAYSGTFVTSSDYVGVTILDSTEKFSLDKIVDFPTEYFFSKPKGKNLDLVKINYGSSPTTEKDTILTPIKIYRKKIKGTELSVTEYNLTYGSATINTGLMRYEFDRLEESNDSLTLFNVTKKFGGKDFLENTSFEKGNIKIVENDDKKLLYIQIKRPIIERGSIYKPTSPLELVPNQPIVGVATYEFYPRDSLTTENLSEFGLWRRIK